VGAVALKLARWGLFQAANSPTVRAFFGKLALKVINKGLGGIAHKLAETGDA
jgi:hypothetical protein